MLPKFIDLIKIQIKKDMKQMITPARYMIRRLLNELSLLRNTPA